MSLQERTARERNVSGYSRRRTWPSAGPAVGTPQNALHTCCAAVVGNGRRQPTLGGAWSRDPVLLHESMVHLALVLPAPGVEYLASALTGLLAYLAWSASDSDPD